MTDKIREAFEAYVKSEIVSPLSESQALERDDSGDYITWWVRNDWRSWPAAWQAATLAERERCLKWAKLTYMPNTLMHYIESGI